MGYKDKETSGFSRPLVLLEVELGAIWVPLGLLLQAILKDAPHGRGHCGSYRRPRSVHNPPHDHNKASVYTGQPP